MPLSKNQKRALWGCGCSAIAGMGMLLALICHLDAQLSDRPAFIRVDPYPYKKAIEAVLAQGRQAGQNTQSVAQIVKRLEAIDISQCPAPFQQAFLNHTSAWEEMAEVEVEAKEWNQNYNSWTAFGESFLEGMVFDFSMIGKADAARDKLQKDDKEASDDIRTTFNKVQQLAVEYGANVTPTAPAN